MSDRFQQVGAWIKRQRNTFDLFPAYARAVYEAWQDYLWKVLVPAPIIVWWLVANPPAVPAPPMLLVIGAFLWTFLIATYYTWRKERIRLIPTIKLKDIRQQQAQAGPATRTYIQLVMVCGTETPIEECKGWLVHVWKWSNDVWEEIEPNQPLRLNWSPGKDEPIPLPPGVPEIIDVLFISDRDPNISFCSPWVPQRGKTINLEQPSLLKFEVVINGRDANSHQSLPALQVSFKVSIQQWPVIDSIERL